MKKVDVVIIEVGVDYTERIKVLERCCETVRDAIQKVEQEGYDVIPNIFGGQNDHYGDYIAVTVAPPTEPQFDLID